MNIIKFENVSFSYNGETENGECEVPAIDGLSFGIKKGEFIAVLGHNGSGKSTVAKLISGILQPTAGRVFVNGIDTAQDERLFEIRSTCGMVFQNPDNQIVASVVEEDVAFAPENMGLPPELIRKRVDDALAAVGMSEYKRHAPHLLSGGQKQRIAIAGVLAMQPECIIMDEPTAMLDPRGREEVMKTVTELRQKMGITMVIITHHMDEAAMCDRIIVLNKGRIAMRGTPKEIFGQVERLDELGLSVPHTVRLMHELKKCGFDADECVLTPEECADEIIKLLEKTDIKTEI